MQSQAVELRPEMTVQGGLVRGADRDASGVLDVEPRKPAQPGDFKQMALLGRIVAIPQVRGCEPR